MTRRKYISWKTKCAAAVLDAQLIRERFGLDPARWYRDAKKMTEDQFLSLFQWDHSIFISAYPEERALAGRLGFLPPNPNVFWNLTPMLIQEHREKTKADVKVIAKGKRIRARNAAGSSANAHSSAPWRTGSDGDGATLVALKQPKPPHPTRRSRKLQSRGFDKRFSRKMSGKVVKREKQER